MATVLEKRKLTWPAQPITFEQFLVVVDEDDNVEWVDGKVIFKGTESAAHQDLLVFLMCLLKWHTEDHDAGKVLGNPFLMRLPHSARAPDLLFIANANLFLLEPVMHFAVLFALICFWRGYIERVSATNPRYSGSAQQAG